MLTATQEPFQELSLGFPQREECGKGGAVHHGELHLERHDEVEPLLPGEETGEDRGSQNPAFAAILRVGSGGEPQEHVDGESLDAENANEQEPGAGVEEEIVECE